MKEQDTYLGDILHESGLSKSVKVTVDKRYGRAYSAILEVASILEDFRIDSIGGLKVGLEIFELAIVPSLLNNSDTWVEIDKETEKKLDNLQNIMFRSLFAVPSSTPKPILRWDLRQLSMREKIHVRKLNFLLHLKTLPSSSLGGEFFDAQVKMNFPGLVKECKELLKFYNLPDITLGKNKFTKVSWKNLVKKAIYAKSEQLLRKEMSHYE